MRNTIIIITLLLANTFLNAQTNWDIKDFSGIDISGNIHVLLEKDSTENVVITPPNHLISDINIYVDNGVLKIHALKSLIRDQAPINVTITYIQLNSIKAIAGTEIYSNEAIESDNFWVKAGSGAQIELTIYAETLDARATEGGELELRGEVNSQYAYAATGGEYDGLELTCAQTQARATTGGEVMVSATETFSANANTGGQIGYLGEAKVQAIQTGFSGKVKKLRDKGVRIEWNN